MLNAHSRPRQQENVKAYELWDELVIYSPEQEKTVSLNASAKAIWELCDGQHTMAEINRKLSQKFDSPEAELQTDVKAAILRLYELNLLTLGEEED